MTVNNTEIQKLIQNISDQFRHINNPQFKESFAALDVSSDDWRNIERLSSASEAQAIQGYDLKELYEQILAVAKFIYYARKRIVTNLPKPSNATVFDKMVITNFPGNLNVLSEQVRALYGKLLVLDSENSKPICHTIPELDRTLGYLKESEG
jgi:hypothetical protein